MRFNGLRLFGFLPSLACAQPTFLNYEPILDSVHPGFELANLLPEGVPNKILGMDWMPNGDMALLAIQDSVLPQTGGGHGWIHILTGAKAAPAQPPSLRNLYYGFENPMGLAVANGHIYVSQRESLVKLVDGSQDGQADSLATIVMFPNAQREGGFGRWAMNLRHRDGVFYTGLGAYHFVEGDGPCLPSPERGTIHTVDTSGKVELLGRGLREPNGVGFGPDGEIFATDNDGEWVAANKLVHVRKDAFYGLVPCRQWDPTLRHTLPAVWFPQHLRSPGQPMLLTQGPFQGQMVVGDYVTRNLSRIHLEKVNGEYQGAVFPFTGGLASGGLRLLGDESGAIYIGEMTIESYEAWYVSAEKRPAPGALEKMVPRSAVSAFEILSLRATQNGFDMEFTLPAGDQAGDLGSYRIQQWRLESTANYGSDKLDLETLRPTQVRVSPDRKTVSLVIPGLKPGRIIHLQIQDGFRGARGEKPWAYHAWYTLNAIPGVLAIESHSMEGHRLSESLGSGIQVRFSPRHSRNLSITTQGSFGFELFDTRGQSRFRGKALNSGTWQLDPELKEGYYLLRIRTTLTCHTQGLILP